MPNPLTFVIMAFGEKPNPAGGAKIQFDHIYKDGIRPALEAARLRRRDEAAAMPRELTAQVGPNPETNDLLGRGYRDRATMLEMPKTTADNLQVIQSALAPGVNPPRGWTRSSGSCAGSGESSR